MADDREQQFERALARLLRDASPASPCPDAETLSAYHEGTLPPEQMAALKEHITACVACQEVLTLVAQSENVPFEEWQNDKVPVLAAHAKPAPAEEAALRGLSGARATSAVSAEIPAARARANWRWLVPVGALAAGLIAWVGVREAKLQHRNEQQTVQNARNTTTEPALIQPPTAPSGALNDQGQPAVSSELQRQIAREKDLSALPQSKEAKQKPAYPPVDHAPALKKVLPSSRVPAGNATNALVAPRREPPPPSQYNSKEVSRDRNAPANSAQNNADTLMQGRSMQQVMVTPAPAPPPAPAASAVAAAKSAPVPSPPSPSRAAMGAAGGLSAAATPEDKKKLAKPTNEKGRLSGRVTDPSGTVVPGTNVQLFDQNGKLVATTSTDTSGNYSVSLPTGQYRLELQQAGFKTNVIDQLNVSSGENRLDGELQVGSTAETVEVSSQTALVQTESSPALPYSADKLVDLQKIAALDQRYILATSGKYIWRLGQAGKIERSSDHGKTWHVQQSGVTTDLTTGSAPSAKICWVVGKSGTVLLTTDSGANWRQLVSPINADLGGIHAIDATHASVWDVSKRFSFETSDGGATWTRSGNQ
jgi:anti-sigma factor RsiW